MRSHRGLVAFAVVAAVGIGSASCGGKPASISSQIEQWSAGAGFPALDQALVADFPALDAGMRGPNLKALKTACAGFAIDAGNIYNTLVTPSVSLTALLNTALTGFANDAQRCSALGSDTPRSSARLQSSLKSHEAEYARAERIIAAAGGD